MFGLKGQTESTAGISCASMNDPTVGHVGHPLICNDIKLVSVPEMGFLVSENKGELCVRGANVFKVFK